ncbi:TolC family protein [Marinoscillum sp. MHG1-6]|uniref:TolC family protein n=1 Tax=Marinoscillum sp. MHG1-6 TaxID=2959627 RepID=UPI0021588531|nr:TolC family protein [Marinoscillum sp. MHG1-6]
MINKFILIVAIAAWPASYVLGQESDTFSMDSTTLSLAEVINLATNYHPVLRQANLQEEFAKMELLAAKGQLDPKIVSAYSQKSFKDTDYYQKFQTSIKVPLWFPIDPKIEVSQNQGDYLNPENYISSTTDYWQITTGVSLPIGKGLFIDERRSLIKQARVYQDMAMAEQIKLGNKVLYTIIKSYWDWHYASLKYDVFDQVIQVAETLYNQTRMNYELGASSAVDTIQALITLQTRRSEAQKQKQELIQSRLQLSIHLWGPDNIPMELSENVKPEYINPYEFTPADTSIQKLIFWAQENHPEILKLEGKREQLEIQEKWKKESLKPEINLNYSLIDAPIYYDGLSLPKWQDNYKFGMDFSFPLYLRKERAGLQKTRLYQQSVDFDLAQQKRQIEADIKSTYNTLQISEQLVSQYQEIASNYETLLQAELLNVTNGQSDLFKFNAQQDKLLASKMKLLDAEAKLQKLRIALPYVVGLTSLSYSALYE